MAKDLIHLVQEYSFYAGCLVFTFGVIGNVFNIVAFAALKFLQRKRCAFYFTVESIANTVQLIVIFLIRLSIEKNDADPADTSPIWCKMRAMIISSCSLVTFVTISFAACDQYLSTTHRLTLRRLGTYRSTRHFISTIMIFAVIHSISYGITFEIRPSTGCGVISKVMSHYVSFFYYPVLSGILPIVIASLFGLLAFRNARRLVRRQLPLARRRLDRQLTAMVLMRVIFFIVFTLPYTMYRMYSHVMKVTVIRSYPTTSENLASALTGLSFNVNCAVRPCLSQSIAA